MGKIRRYYVEINNDLKAFNCNEDMLEYIGQDSLDNIESIIQSHDLETLKETIMSLKAGENADVCFRMLDKDNKLNWMSAKAHRSKHNDSIVRLDIYDLQSFEMDIPEGYYDDMTGVLSKSSITDYAKKLMEKTPAKQFYFFLMDVDNFKQINDKYGHDAGDDVLRAISNGLKEFFTNTDAYRYGGDEFLLIRKDLDTGLFANQLHQMRNRMDKLSHSDNKPDIKFSAGYVYGVAETADDLRSMFVKADELMYEVKRQGKEDMLGQRYA